MKAQDIKKVLIIGAGTMGQQIAAQFAMHGLDVVLYDIEQELLDAALARTQKLICRLAACPAVSAEQAEAATRRISALTDPAKAAQEVDLINESVPEDPELKGRVFAEFHTLCPARAIFTTNTSTLLPSQFADATGRPEKFLALHFHDLRTTNVVDVMPHPGTAPQYTELVADFARRTGLNPIVMQKEYNGYVFNNMFMALLQSAQTIAARGVASVEDIDRAWMGVTHMPIGPFGLMDSIGLDTVWKVTDYWARKTNHPQSIKNAEFLKQYLDQGAKGQKTKKGFYDYPEPKYIKPGFVNGKENA